MSENEIDKEVRKDLIKLRLGRKSNKETLYKELWDTYYGSRYWGFKSFQDYFDNESNEEEIISPEKYPTKFKQNRVIQFIKEYSEKTGYPPSELLDLGTYRLNNRGARRLAQRLKVKIKKHNQYAWFCRKYKLMLLFICFASTFFGKYIDICFKRRENEETGLTEFDFYDALNREGGV